MSARDLARSCFYSLISTIKALLLKLHDAESHKNPDFRASAAALRLHFFLVTFSLLRASLVLKLLLQLGPVPASLLFRVTVVQALETNYTGYNHLSSP